MVLIRKQGILRKQGLLRLDNLSDSKTFSTCLSSSSQELTQRIQEHASIHLVEQLDTRTLDTLELLGEVFEPDQRYSRAEYSTLETYHNCALIIAEISHNPAGLILNNYNPKFEQDTWYIYELAVLEKYQGRGIAKMLLTITEHLAQLLGYSKIGLHCVEENKQGRKLPEYYNALGFHRTGERTSEGVCMIKELNKVDLKIR